VKIATAIYGVHAAGTAYRMDEIPIPLRPFLDSTLPTDEQVLGEIQNRLA
jgi:formylmethanofuran dehydrogenase subunit B